MKKILVIDDDPDILQAIELVLQSGGYDAQTTTKGSEVYKKINTYKPNLIILDVLLSGNDGRIVCKTLKGNKKTRDIPVIMISAHPTAKDSVKECGADSFVPKPFSVDRLLTEVGKIIGK